MSVISLLKNHLKNIKGKKVSRKLLAFSVDDYGNIRLANAHAKENLLGRGIKLNGRFDHLDALDTREDYEMLFEVLSSVKDKKDNPAIFTPYALPCNTDYQKTIESDCFIPENLDVAYKRLGSQDKAFEGAYEILLDGIRHKLIKPQFPTLYSHSSAYHLNEVLDNNLVLFQL